MFYARCVKICFEARHIYELVSILLLGENLLLSSAQSDVHADIQKRDGCYLLSWLVSIENTYFC